MKSRYSVGIDFGTLSARAVLLDTQTGKEIETSVYGYQDAVIDTFLPDTYIELPPDFALQNPMNYKDATEALLSDIWRKANVKPEDIISIGIDFTACTVLPVDETMVPLCFYEKYRDNPHSWVKLWKHHGAQREADIINETALRRGEEFIRHYGGTSSSEWFFAKLMEIYNKAPDIYEATYKFVEAGDWVVWLLTDNLATSTCMAGYKAFWNEREGYPSEDFFAAIDPGIRYIADKAIHNVCTVGSRAGGLTEEMAERTGLKAGTSVAVCIIDAHAAMPVVGITQDNFMMMTMGTSLCHIMVSKQEVLAQGICGVVKDGVLPGYYGYETGQAAVGDIFDWFISNLAPKECVDEANEYNRSIFSVMDARAEKLKPGESGLIALDWWNGSRSMLNDSSLSGMIVGMTLQTSAEEIYRALIEATAFGTRNIIESLERLGLQVDSLFACGGLSRKSSFIMQVFADVLGSEIYVTNIAQATAYGAAMYGMVAAGPENGGYSSPMEATAQLCSKPSRIYCPDKNNHAVYSDLFDIYMLAHDFFGKDQRQAMVSLRQIKERVGAARIK